MLKKLLIVPGLVTTFLIAVAFITPPKTKRSGKTAAVKTIVIDPGHGGIDPGCHGLFSHESAVALEISLKLGKAIQKEFPDVKIIYTRTTDILPGNSATLQQGLHYRAAMANESKADLFISIHCNATGQRAGGWYAKRVIGHRPKTVYVGKGKKRRKKTISEPIYESYWVENKRTGTETYIWAADRSDEKQQFVPEEEQTGEQVEDSTNVLDLNSPEAKIRAQLYTKYFFRNSAHLAYLVESEFKLAGRNSGGVMQRNYKGIWVLQATGMPSILIETGFLTNKQEELYLNSDEGQAEVVKNIVSAFGQYKQSIENPTKGNGNRPDSGAGNGSNAKK